jgi:hypothetical protein
MTTSSESLTDCLKNAEDAVPPGSRYAHYKDRARTYRVVTIALIESTLEPAVVYEAEYGDCLSFIRPLTNFLETVSFEGNAVPRFSRLADNS